ncbi:MAG: DUF3820 family protein [Flavobacteriales bacterium]|nr:DUF3820 family protein [Flavobacteriales bacterium]
MLKPDPKILLELSSYKMPFGKYKNWKIMEIPVYYLEWFATKGFPTGKLGMMLSTAHVIRTNGLEHLVPKG